MVDLIIPLLTGLAAIDLFFNSPLNAAHHHHSTGIIPRNLAAFKLYLALIGSLAAAIVGDTQVMLVAQAVWVGLLIELVVVGHRPVVADIIHAVEVVTGHEDKKGEAFPTVFEDLMADSRQKFEKNLDANTTCDGTSWKLQDDSAGVRVSQAEFPGQSSKRWKVECEILAKKEDIISQLFEYDKRCGGSGGWDPSVASGKVVKTWKNCNVGDEAYLSVYYTAPAAGGAVSSRELVDLGVLINLPDGGMHYVNTSVRKHASVCREIPTTVTGVRAFTHRGSGMSITPVDPSNPQNVRWKYVMINALDLQGWLLASIVNAATTDALKTSHVTMIAHMKKVLESKSGAVGTT